MAKPAIDPVLRELTPFAGCSRHELRLASRLVRHREVDPGDVIMRQGDIGREVMVITDGAATVTRDGHEVAVLARGEVVGELSMLARAPRSATVAARSAMTVAVFDNHDFAAVLDTSPDVAGVVLRSAVRRLAA